MVVAEQVGHPGRDVTAFGRREGGSAVWAVNLARSSCHRHIHARETLTTPLVLRPEWGDPPARAGQTASPLSENPDSRRMAKASAAMVTITPMISAVLSVRPAFRAVLCAIEFATPREYCSTESSRAPLTKLPSTTSQIRTYSSPTG